MIYIYILASYNHSKITYVQFIKALAKEKFSIIWSQINILKMIDIFICFLIGLVVLKSHLPMAVKQLNLSLSLSLYILIQLAKKI